MDVLNKIPNLQASNIRRGSIKYSINDEMPIKHTPISMTATRATNTWGVYRLPDFAQIGDGKVLSGLRPLIRLTPN